MTTQTPSLLDTARAYWGMFGMRAKTGHKA